MNNKILKLEFISMLIINLLSTFYITYTKYITNNDYLNIILSIIFIIPIYIIFYIIFNYKDKLSINDKIKVLLGPKIGIFLNIIIIGIIYIITSFNLYMLIYYINLYYLNKTPLLVIGISFLIPLIFLNIKGLKGIARLSFILLFLNIIIYIFLFFKLVTFIKLNNIIPSSLNINVSFKYVVLNITNIFIFLIIPKKDIINNKHINKYIFISLITTTIIISILLFISIGILGIKLFNYFDYPIYTLFKRIHLFNFINRLENIFFLTIINNSFINISLSLYYLNKILNKKNNKLFIYYLNIIVLISSLFIFNKLYNVTNIIIIYTLLIIIMFILSIIISIKKIMNKSLF